jgi:hypothetical protein
MPMRQGKWGITGFLEPWSSSAIESEDEPAGASALHFSSRRDKFRILSFPLDLAAKTRRLKRHPAATGGLGGLANGSSEGAEWSTFIGGGYDWKYSGGDILP